MRKPYFQQTFRFLLTALLLSGVGCALDPSQAGLAIGETPETLQLTPEQVAQLQQVATVVSPCIANPAACETAPQPPVETGLCPSLGPVNAEANTPMLMSTSHTRLEFVADSGVFTTIDLPTDSIAIETIKTSEVRYTEPYFAVSRKWLSDPASPHLPSINLTVIHKNGEVLWNHTGHGYGVSTYFVHSDGSVLANKDNPWSNGEQGATEAILVHPDGSVTEIAGWLVLGHQSRLPDFTDTQVIPVKELDGARRVGWYQADMGLFTQVHEGIQGLHVHYFQDRFVWLQEGKTAPWLMIANRGKTGQIHPLWDVPNRPKLRLFQQRAPRWLRIKDVETDEQWRVELTLTPFGNAIAGVVGLDLTPPEDLMPLKTHCGTATETLDAHGRLLVFLRAGENAWAYRFDPVTQEYEALGAAMTTMAGGQIYNNQGTYVVHAVDNGDTFCPVEDWGTPTPGSTALVGNSTQVVHPSTGNTFVLGSGLPWGKQVTMHSTGLCFLNERWDLESDSRIFVVTDVLTATETQLSFSKFPYWVQ